jgi:hypothetical protein
VRDKSVGMRNTAEKHAKATILLRVKVVRKKSVVYLEASTLVEAGSESEPWGCMGSEYYDLAISRALTADKVLDVLALDPYQSLVVSERPPLNGIELLNLCSLVRRT